MSALEGLGGVARVAVVALLYLELVNRHVVLVIARGALGDLAT